MKTIIVFILFFVSLDVWSENQEVNINEVGLSMNSNRVFIVTAENATSTSDVVGCTTNNEFSISTTHPEAYLFYSAALTAKKENKKMRIRYSDAECIGNAQVVTVFWNL